MTIRPKISSNLNLTQRHPGGDLQVKGWTDMYDHLDS